MELQYAVVWNCRKQVQGAEEHREVGERGETVSVTDQVIAPLSIQCDLVNNGHVRDLHGSPANIIQRRHRNVPHCLPRGHPGALLLILAGIDERGVDEDAEVRGAHEERPEKVPRCPLSARRRVFIT